MEGYLISLKKEKKRHFTGTRTLKKSYEVRQWLPEDTASYAEYVDEMDNYYCEDCYVFDMLINDKLPEDYETINGLGGKI